MDNDARVGIDQVLSQKVIRTAGLPSMQVLNSSVHSFHRDVKTRDRLSAWARKRVFS